MSSSNNNKLQILALAVDPVQPRIASRLFSTELVINRNQVEDGNVALDIFYHLFAIHVSLSFLFSPMLFSGLPRFLSRNYKEVFQFAGTTDTDISTEHQLLKQCVCTRTILDSIIPTAQVESSLRTGSTISRLRCQHHAAARPMSLL